MGLRVADQYPAPVVTCCAFQSCGEAGRAIGWFKRAIVPRPDMMYQIERGSKSLTRATHENDGSGKSLRLRAPLLYMTGQSKSLLPVIPG
jgi:hypothetical protein